MSRSKVPFNGVTLILDAYNVIHAVPQLERFLDKRLEAARKALTELCAAYLNRKGNIAAVTLVFDGRSPSSFGWMDDNGFCEQGVQGIFSEKGQSADDKIIELLEAVSDTSKICVVSNDNYVKNNARSQGASSMTVQDFAANLLGDEIRSRPRAAKGLSQTALESITNDYKNYLGIKD